jgi:hypothetical protein
MNHEFVSASFLNICKNSTETFKEGEEKKSQSRVDETPLRKQTTDYSSSKLTDLIRGSKVKHYGKRNRSKSGNTSLNKGSVNHK